MTHTPPVPDANKSPYPLREAPHKTPSAANRETVDTRDGESVAASADGLGPTFDKAKAFASDRPFATAALIGTIAVAIFTTLRGKRS